jgi:hypothetical protein
MGKPMLPFFGVKSGVKYFAISIKTYTDSIITNIQIMANLSQ